MGEVVTLDIQPKTLKRTYKRMSFTVTFVPSTKRWKWTVEVPIVTRYSDTAKDMRGAIRAAEKCIDQCLAAQGREVG